MASKTTTRSIQSLSRQARRSCCHANPIPSRSCIRQFSSTTSSKSDSEYRYERQPGEKPPRWAVTPPQMKAPFRYGKKRIEDTEAPWKCNEDPARLDNFYIKFLGRGGDKVLTEEVKWLAITHKSFDQGRRGYNDKLAFLGRRILNLQTSLELLYSPEIRPHAPQKALNDDRVPFTHPALDGLANLTNVPLSEVLNKTRIAQLAGRMGMRDILRWVPRMPTDMEKSGIEVVLTTTVYAIIGAIALQRGGDVANTAARERVLKPLGIC